MAKARDKLRIVYIEDRLPRRVRVALFRGNVVELSGFSFAFKGGRADLTGFWLVVRIKQRHDDDAVSVWLQRARPRDA